jgi:hypothetical protein
MDRFGISDLRQLTDPNEGPCVTICLPTHVAGADGQQDAVRLKNLADRAERQLAEGWLRAPEARDLVAPVRALPTDHEFWHRRSHGLALFLDRGSLRRFRVPIDLEELVLVNRRFHVKALLPLLTSGDRFFVLVLSQHNVRLFEATQYQIEQVDVAGLPQRMDEALNLDGADRGSQSHFAMKGGKKKQSSVFHGQGGVPDSHKDELAQFFRLIDSALVPVLRDETTPLILAGVDYLLPIFRKACRYAQLARPELVGNFDHLSARQIHEKVWPLAKPLLNEARERSAAKYCRLAGTGKTTDDIREAISAAVAGRVESLFVASDHWLWGVCDPQGKVIDLHDSPQPGDDDLLDSVAVQALLHRGSVFVVQGQNVPSSRQIAAVMRF